MKSLRRGSLLASGVVVLTGLFALLALTVVADAGDKVNEMQSLDWQLPSAKRKLPFKDEIPLVFVSRGQNLKEWNQLGGYWNEGTEKVLDPSTGQEITRKVIKIKVPLGLSQGPPVPMENPMTVQRWALGKRLYFDKALSADNSVACATCHNPKQGYTDQAHVSTGIGGNRGGVSAPTVFNTAYNALQFWDGRAISLEDQAQGPVQNALEMFDGKGHAWNRSVQRIRAKDDYTARFLEAFGHEPTRDGIAKAIATYERTVLKGNSIYDRADLAARKRVSEEGGPDFTPKAEDFAAVLQQAVKANDLESLEALGFKGEAKAGEFAQGLANGRNLFFGKARCSLCHIGDNFTDNGFHNLGVGVKDGQIPKDGMGRFAQLPIGHKNPELISAFKTPTLRGLVGTGPYLHDGSEKTLEAVVDFYDRGGNANAFLSTKMRDTDAERAYALAQKNDTPYKGPKAFVIGPDETVIVPFALKLTKQEKADLVLFLRALEGDAIDAVIADPNKMPSIASSSR